MVLSMGEVAGVYFVIMAAVFVVTSFLARRVTRGFDDYSVAGRRIGGLINGMGGMACYLSGFLFMGMTGAVWATGFPYMGILVPFALSIAMFMVLIGPYARNTGSRTLIEFMELRYGKAVAYLALAINLLFVGMFMVGQMKAVGICMEYIAGTSYSTGILIGGIILTTYCVLGGMLGISWNQFVQGLVMLIGIAVSLALVFKSLGVSGWQNPFLGYGELSPMMEKEGFYGLAKTPQYYVSLILPGLGGAAAAPQVFAITARAKDAPSTRWALSWMVFLIGLVYACAMGFAFAATYWTKAAGITIGEVQADYLLFMLCEATVPNYVGAFVVAGALAAEFSTLAVLILFCGTVSVSHIYEPLKKFVGGNRGVGDRERVMVMAAAMTIAGMVCVLLAWSPPPLLVVPIIWGWELLTCTFLIPCLFACWWKRATRWGTLASMLSGLMVILTQGWTGPVFSLPFYGSLVFLPVAILVHIAVSYLTRPDPASRQVDSWHGFVDSSERRYSGNLLPVALGIVSILVLVFGVQGLC